MRVFTLALACSIVTAACGGKTAAPPVPPAAPAGLAATGGNGQIALTWTAVPGATSYLILRGDAAGAEALLTPPATAAAAAYTDTGLTAGKTYYYVVEAKNSAGPSAKSNEASATTTPPAPTGLTATGGAGQVALSWTAVAGATGYSLSRGSAAGGPYTEIATPSGTSYTDSTVASGTAYYYVVQGVTAQGKTDPSAEAPALTAPDAPAGVIAAPASTHVDLSWTASTGASGYDVLRAPGGTTTFAVAGSTASTALSDTGLSPGTAYSYVVRARNASGTSANSSPALNVTTGPPAPTGVTLASGNAKLALSWIASSGASGYDVLRSTTSGSGYASIGKPAGTSLTDTAVINGTTYYYIVRATSSAGVSDDAGPVTGAPHREICVSNSASNVISVFNAEQTGNVAPIRSYGSLTGMATPTTIAVDNAHGEYFVTNRALGTVTAHARLANGNIAPVRTLSGLPGVSSVAYDLSSDQVMVGVGNSIDTFARTASGNASPLRTLTLPSGVTANEIALAAKNDRMFVPGQGKIYVYSRTNAGTTAPIVITSLSITFIESIAYDPTADEILVGNAGATESIFAFPASSIGSTAPSRTLSGSNTVFSAAQGLAVDAVNNLLYVADDGLGALFVFPRGFTGNANIAPSATLGGALTQLAVGLVHKTAVDTANNEVQVLNANGRILVFKNTDNGNIKPQRVIGAASTGLDQPQGLRADVVHGEIFVTNQGQTPSITAHALSATGGAAALRTIAGPINTGLSSGVNDVQLDLAHDELIASPFNPPAPSVPIFARTASGDVAPLRTISGNITTLSGSGMLGFDTKADTVFVQMATTILSFARAFTNGNEAPPTSISGSSTGMSSPRGIFVDTVNNEIAVADAGTVLFFSRTLTGNIAPLRTLIPQAPVSLATVYVDAVANELFVLDAFSIAVYPRGGSGAAIPLRRITGPATALAVPRGMDICN